MGRHFFVGLGGGAWVGGDARGMQELVGQCFVVHHEQTALAAGGIAFGSVSGQTKVLHAVMVVA